MTWSGPSARKGPGMRTSAEHPAALRALPYDHPEAQYLVERVQQEYVQRYGGRAGAVVDPAEFLAPPGIFLRAGIAGVAAGCGAFFVHESGTAEIKRVYV